MNLKIPKSVIILTLMCLHVGLGLAHRSCLANGVWGTVDARDCESVAVREVRTQVSILYY